ncbi:MAG: LTA synthase family protein [Cytophagales bacterium]|nr:MAG: LTA synthase family protein [Cytophagales bacterium]
MYKSQIYLAIKSILLLMLMYSLTRFFFLAYNWSFFAEASWGVILNSFILGLRFDISVVLLINSIYIAILLFPIKLVTRDGVQLLLKSIYFLINIPLLIINLADVPYFSFKGKRTTFEIIGIAEDVIAQIGQLTIHYWFIPILVVIMIVFLWKLYPRFSISTPISPYKWYDWGLFVLFIACSVIGIRGGLQLKPIRPNMAFVFSPNVVGNVVLNTPFVMVHSSQLPLIERISFFSEQTALDYIKIEEGNKEIYRPIISGKPNVVIFILESFSSEYTSFANPWKGYTPFLDSISAQGLFFAHHLANGRTSIEGLPAIMASLPSLMREPFITSAYQGNQIFGLADVFRSNGYTTSFYHGGNNGTMGFDVFAKNAGFSNYYGRNEYPNIEKHDDGNWGIFDHYFFQYFAHQLEQTPKPFFSAIFTLSSHQPYTIPENFKAKYFEGPIPIIKTIKYADDALRSFFDTAKKMKWYSNTIFVFTADHTQDKIQPWSVYNDFHVPLLFFSPQWIKSYTVKDKLSQHLDISPTLLDMLNIVPLKKSIFGNSLFNKNYSGRAINYDGNSENTLLVKRNGISTLSIDGKISHMDFQITNTSVLDVINDSLKQQYSQELKAMKQLHNNGLIDNNIYR